MSTSADEDVIAALPAPVRRRRRLILGALTPFLLVGLIGLFIRGRRGTGPEWSLLLLIPGGGALTVMGVLMAAGWLPPARRIGRRGAAAVGVAMAAYGLAGLGVGLGTAGSDRWYALCLPSALPTAAFGAFWAVWGIEHWPDRQAIDGIARHPIAFRLLGVFMVAMAAFIVVAVREAVPIG